MKLFSVKEIFYTLQGEGINSGMPAVFCRFSGCNSWDGRPETKSESNCPFCDTDFFGTDGILGGRYTAPELAGIIAGLWSRPTKECAAGRQLVVLTGGEPALQLDAELIAALKDRQLYLAIETNGSASLPEGIDWVTVSPKPGLELRQLHGQELKLLYPLPGLEPEKFQDLRFEHFLLSPVWDSDVDIFAQNTRMALDYCLNNPRWRLNTQNHKVWKIR